MDRYEIGKDVQAILSAATSLDRKLSAQGCECDSQSSPERPSETAQSVPCLPSRIETTDYDFAARIRSTTIISNTSRNNDYLVAVVTDSNVYGRNQRDERIDFGTNLYLGVRVLQPMVLLGQMIHRLATTNYVQINYGINNYTDSPNGIPLIYGIKADWEPSPTDFSNGGEGFITSLEAYVTRNCSLNVRAILRKDATDRGTAFRAGNYASEKLAVLVTAYYFGVREKLQLDEIRFTGASNDLILDRMKMF